MIKMYTVVVTACENLEPLPALCYAMTNEPALFKNKEDAETLQKELTAGHGKATYVVATVEF